MPTDTSAATDGPGETLRRAPRVGARTLRIIVGALAVVLVLSAATATWAWTRAAAADERRQERAAAATVATQFALRVDNFDGEDIDAYSKSIKQLLTTKYKAEFDKQFTPFKELYTQAKAVGTGKVLMAGVGSFDDDSATVLVVHDGMVESEMGQSQVRHQRWTVELAKVDGTWLVDDFTPVN